MSGKDHWSNGARSAVFVFGMPGFSVIYLLALLLFPSPEMFGACIVLTVLTAYVYVYKKMSFADVIRAAMLFITGRRKTTKGHMDQ